MTETIALNPMVRRQKRHSKFSHFEPKSGNERDTWSELLALISDYLATNPERTLLQRGQAVLQGQPARGASRWLLQRRGASPREHPSRLLLRSPQGWR
jgi:hypothetical protein